MISVPSPLCLSFDFILFFVSADDNHYGEWALRPEWL